MDNEFFNLPGQRISSDQLSIVKAIEVVKAIESGRLPYVHLVECLQSEDGDYETVIADVEVERAQHPRHNIKPTERVGIVFAHADQAQPMALALRRNFEKAPHTYYGIPDAPVSLCLFEQTYDQVRLRWTATRFIERIREWFRLTARGELHLEDQALEPLVMNSAHNLILPDNLCFDDDKPVELLSVGCVQEGKTYTFICKREDNIVPKGNAAGTVAIAIYAAPQQHGIIANAPDNLEQLHSCLFEAGVNLLDDLQSRLKCWISDRRMLRSNLIIIVSMPKTRVQGGSVEAVDTRAFIAFDSISKIGKDIGIWQGRSDDLGACVPMDKEKQGQDTKLLVLNPMMSLSRQLARELSGLTNDVNPNVVAIGLGALGSQVLVNLVREGYGEWTLIDNDIVLPHNLVRHAGFTAFIGSSKARSLAIVCNDLIDGEPIAKSIIADVMHPGDNRKEIQTSLQSTDVILDMSASVVVSRFITRDADSAARRACMFLNPSGDDSVLLVEDSERRIPLDWLEMQYYRQIIRNEKHENHLQTSQGLFRYANSCSDLSSRVPQEKVALHSAVCASALRLAISRRDAAAYIWHLNSEDFTLKSDKYDLYPMEEIQFGEWKLCTDKWLIDRIGSLREETLPNETGGVLIGSFDTQRKIVYIVDTVPSPPDSQEWPFSYVRGCRGLKERIDEIVKRTGGGLEYVGEWHSHPEGHGCSPSSDDQTAFSWLIGQMSDEGLPALMLIAGDNKEYGWFLGDMR
jgi:integrative and conjugative element protein (TIGR02256 family)